MRGTVELLGDAWLVRPIYRWLQSRYGTVVCMDPMDPPNPVTLIDHQKGTTKSEFLSPGFFWGSRF